MRSSPRRSHPDDVVLLANGCLCCTAGDDLVQTLWALTRRDGDRPRRIVVETTGLADPVPLLHRLIGDPRISNATRLDAMVATVDAVNGLRNLDDQGGHLAPGRGRRSPGDHQGRSCRGRGRSTRCADRLDALNPGAAIREASFGAIDAERIVRRLALRRGNWSRRPRALARPRQPPRPAAASPAARPGPLQRRSRQRRRDRHVAGRRDSGRGLGGAVAASRRDHRAARRLAASAQGRDPHRRRPAAAGRSMASSASSTVRCGSNAGPRNPRPASSPSATPARRRRWRRSPRRSPMPRSAIAHRRMVG